MANSAFPFDIFTYVNPETREVDEMYAFSPLGIFRREDGEWNPVTREESNLGELAGHIAYDVDWSIDPEPMDEYPEDDLTEHQLVELFDNEEITEDLVKQYSVLYSDPTSTEDDDISFDEEELA